MWQHYASILLTRGAMRASPIDDSHLILEIPLTSLRFFVLICQSSVLPARFPARSRLGSWSSTWYPVSMGRKNTDAAHYQ